MADRRDYFNEIPYTLDEVKLVIETHHMDTYHKELMKWLLSLIEKAQNDKKSAHS